MGSSEANYFSIFLSVGQQQEKNYFYFIFFNVTPTAVSSIWFGLVVYCFEHILSIVRKGFEKKALLIKDRFGLGWEKVDTFFSTASTKYISLSGSACAGNGLDHAEIAVDCTTLFPITKVSCRVHMQQQWSLSTSSLAYHRFGMFRVTTPEYFQWRASHSGYRTLT